MLKKINAKIENLFEQNPRNLLNAEQNIEEIKKLYQPVTENKMLENLSYVFEGEITEANLSNFFFQLSSYFEVGILLKKDSQLKKYVPQELFFFSRKMPLPSDVPPLALPHTSLFKIAKSNSIFFLSHFNLQNFDSNNRMSSYIMRISNTFTLILISQTAEPWIKLRIEALQNTLMKIDFNL